VVAKLAAAPDQLHVFRRKTGDSMTEPTFEKTARETAQLALILVLNGMTYETFLNLGEAGQKILAASGQMNEDQLKIAMRQINGYLKVRLRIMHAAVENFEGRTEH
jgi:hypothetical protein